MNPARCRTTGKTPCLAAFALAFLAMFAQAQGTRMSLDGDTGLLTWETQTDDLHLRLTQISPDQARAFMQARGLDEKSVWEFARVCVYMTVVRNEGRTPIRYSLDDWRYVPQNGSAQLMLSKHDWLAKWRPRKLAGQARLAFEWSQFPFEQTFAPGDWNQGMTTFELPAGSRFDLLYRWWKNDKVHEGRLRDVQCPERFE